MKKAVGMILLLALVAAVFISAPRIQEEEIEEETEEPQSLPEIVETEPIRYLTDYELSMLYTCCPDERKVSDNIVELSIDDAVLLLQVGRSEGGPSEEGQFWVMRTIYNRYLDGWGDSIWDILNEDNPVQFTVVENGSYKNADVNVESHLALALLESGYDPTEGSLYWESNTNSPESWHKQNLTFVKEVQGNLFYK
jgi:hypothetical protein